MRAGAGRSPRGRKRSHIEPRIKVWLEQDGLVVLGDFRAQLLRHVAETGSLTDAARRVGLSYRRAWDKVREIERNLGTRLVESETGGYGGGGGSRLTPEGARLVALYERFRARLESDLAREYRDVFGG